MWSCGRSACHRRSVRMAHIQRLSECPSLVVPIKQYTNRSTEPQVHHHWHSNILVLIYDIDWRPDTSSDKHGLLAYTLAQQVSSLFRGAPRESSPLPLSSAAQEAPGQTTGDSHAKPRSWYCALQLMRSRDRTHSLLHCRLFCLDELLAHCIFDHITCDRRTRVW